MNHPFIDVKGLTKKYRRKTALKKIDLTIDSPGLIGLVGPNGSGKSTLLKTAAGLLRPGKGSVTILGETVSRRIADQAAYLAEVDSLYDYQTVRQAVVFFSRVYPDFSVEKAESLLGELKIDTGMKIKSLSKGNRARVKIAVTLARDVPVLLLDEPLSGLDPIVREEILKMIIRHTDLNRQATVISTHEVAEVEPFLDYIIFVKDGSILLSEDVETLRETRGQSVVQAMREVLS
ncbi:spermidine/putrescine ABC transporter ATP-binding protein [Alteribacter lacisalsi]|uniref:Spermidine/putrescine ABC transporter ATP-binding protein n=1 Tax=Alteribacter lacisalsi TaxID=2045244 RepID=A0A2W0HBA4_9BACI|nr:ABC transporter ATP-binding protein [Alteribacter lacisalsi]PYZ98161.1 spermidine/putrescine ABC transporter ATP-binding protein [Alteribacter lacisalsi]